MTGYRFDYNRLLTVVMTFLVVGHWTAGSSRAETQSSDDMVSELRSAWRELSEDSPSYSIDWQIPERIDTDVFSQHQAAWAAGKKVGKERMEQFTYRLVVDRMRWRYDSQRWAIGTHRRDFVSNDLTARMPMQLLPYIQSFSGEGLSQEFSSNLYNRYRESEVGFLDPQPFTRLMNESGLTDFWHRTSAGFPRITRRTQPVIGSVTWARLVPEENWSDQIDSLHLQAALMASGRIDLLEIGKSPATLSIRPEQQMIHGVDCLVVDEFGDPSKKNYRTFWVDPKNGHRIRRFIGSVLISHNQGDSQRVGAMPGRFDKTQIDVYYGSDQRPTNWIVSAAAPHLYPLFAFSRATVVPFSEVNESKPNASVFNLDIAPIGAWVVDELQNRQYIVKASTNVRLITEEETKLLPRYDDLCRTSAGELAGPSWNPLSAFQWKLGGFGMALLCIAVLRRLVQRRIPPSEQGNSED